VGRPVVYKGFTSVSTDPAVARSFQSGAGMLFVITVVNARPIARYSQYRNENELLLSPGATFTVSKASANEIVMIQVATDVRTVF
jgi:hypothetical protein